eukprot:TRINITY_DN5620_c0_g1_i1.p2 TRINITY_DN5620_c0_g1~~TRINITY_DN5620_c0_g1_i1.p2  ORF type:complete len:55 (-),score=3.64 TRINITY_DN5620_c0_g1_i1:50-214(-)
MKFMNRLFYVWVCDEMLGSSVATRWWDPQLPFRLFFSFLTFFGMHFVFGFSWIP